MKQEEEKQLLLVDLCARLPYGVICKDDYIEIEGKLSQIGINYDMCLLSDEYGESKWAYIPNCKPYLFHLSSMTNEQLYELREMFGLEVEFSNGFIELSTFHHGRLGYLEMAALLDWLNKKHFDYRGLIPLGLAINCTNLNIY